MKRRVDGRCAESEYEKHSWWVTAAFFLPLGHKLKLNSLEGNFRAGVVEMIHAAESAGNIK